MIEDWPDIDTIVVPVGGGGLAAGIAIAARALKDSIRLVGVQCDSYPAMVNALRGSRTPSRGETLAEGIAVKTPGRITTAILRDHAIEMMLVGEATLEQALECLAETTKVVAEGAGAASLAALLKELSRWQGRKVGVILSGGNVDRAVYQAVLQEADTSEMGT